MVSYIAAKMEKDRQQQQQQQQQQEEEKESVRKTASDAAACSMGSSKWEGARTQ